MRAPKSVIAVAIAIVLLTAGTIYAVEPIPEESGFSGYLTVGGGYSHVKSNMISGNKMSNIGNRTVDSLTDSPDSNSTGGPNINFNLRYTFASTRTQLFIGNAMEDALRFDFATQLGVAQELPGNNLVAASVLYSSIPTEVWKDPYVTDFKRSRTDRTSNGFRLAWDRIFGSQLQLQYSYRDIDIDDEYSGIFLGLTPAQQKLLDREGDYHEAEILYRFFFDEKHAIIPSVTYNDYNLDGDAMSNDGVDFGLTYRYRHERFLLSVNGFIGYLSLIHI